MSENPNSGSPASAESSPGPKTSLGKPSQWTDPPPPPVLIKITASKAAPASPQSVPGGKPAFTLPALPPVDPATSHQYYTRHEIKQLISKKSKNFDKPGKSKKGAEPTPKRRKLPPAHAEPAPPDVDENIEKYTQLKLKEMPISKAGFAALMETRYFVPLRKMVKLYRVTNSAQAQSDPKLVQVITSDWVTIGVVVSKLKTSIKLKNKETSLFLWHCHDLLTSSIGVFLQGEVFDAVTSGVKVGAVVAVLNPVFVVSKEGFTVGLQVQKPSQIKILGVAEHYGRCSAVVDAASEKKCDLVIDRSRGQLCPKHILAKVEAMRSTRMELNDALAYTPSKKEEERFEKALHQNLSEGTYDFGDTTILASETFKRAKHKTPAPQFEMTAEVEAMLEKSGNSISARNFLKLAGQFDEVEEQDRVGAMRAELVQAAIEHARTSNGAPMIVHPHSRILYDTKKPAKEKPKENSAEKVVETKVAPEDSGEVEIDLDDFIAAEPEHRAPDLVRYKCQECGKTTDQLCNRIGHHITICERIE